MLVTDIEISHYRYCADTARHKASVCLTLKDRIITLLCQLDLPGDEPGPSRAVAFVRDALRKLNRMPEIRSGQETVEFAGRMSLLGEQKLA